jgi:predicted RNA-binding protein with TRAM domain
MTLRRNTIDVAGMYMFNKTIHGMRNHCSKVVFCIISFLHASHTAIYPVYIRTTTNESLQMSYGRDSSYGRGRGRSYGGGSSRSFNRGSPAPKPVEVGKEYEVDITEISRQGDGIARVQGFVVFVKNVKAGQKVRAKVEQVGNRFATATVVS